MGASLLANGGEAVVKPESRFCLTLIAGTVSLPDPEMKCRLSRSLRFGDPGLVAWNYTVVVQMPDFPLLTFLNVGNAVLWQLCVGGLRPCRVPTVSGRPTCVQLPPYCLVASGWRIESQ